jgi:hypothetical protein
MDGWRMRYDTVWKRIEDRKEKLTHLLACLLHPSICTLSSHRAHTDRQTDIPLHIVAKLAGWKVVQVFNFVDEWLIMK